MSNCNIAKWISTMRKNRFSKDTSDEAQVNLTPLIDVVFVVLIMFILVAPMLELDKVKLAQGVTKETTDTLSSSPLVVHVHENNTIWINKREVSKENLVAVLKAFYKKNPK